MKHPRVSIARGIEAYGSADNVRIANDDVEILVATAYGPRILHYARLGGPNVLGVVLDLPAKATPYGDSWHIRGGHRLWYAPEEDPRTYFPDNTPVSIELGDGSVSLVQTPETTSRLEKRVRVSLEARGARVEVTHELINRGLTTVELAPWALTVMARGGLAVLPQPPFVPHPEALAPARPLVMWPFTRMSDQRWRWGDRVVTLRHDPAMSSAQKVGAYDPQGWLAYLVNGQLFVKCHRPRPGRHADFGSNVEIFTNDAILELETLGPWVELPPGGTVVHVEHWHLFDDIHVADEGNAQAVSEVVAPFVELARAGAG